MGESNEVLMVHQRGLITHMEKKSSLVELPDKMLPLFIVL